MEPTVSLGCAYTGRCYIDESQQYAAERNVSTRKYIPYNVIYMKF